MSSTRVSDGQFDTSGKVLERLLDELRRFNDRFEPVPLMKQPIGYAIIGFALLGASILNPLYAVAGSFMFIAREISRRPPR
jgi:hypothetical protein